MVIKTTTPSVSPYNSTNLVSQGKTKRARRKLAELQPKVIENTKSLLCIKGNKTSEIITECLNDFALLHKPYSKQLLKHNNIQPFNDSSSLEFLGKKNDSSLIVFGQHTKKKPHTVILSRLFDYTIFDMIELQIDTSHYISINEFSQLKKRVATVRIGSSPLLLFQGDLWQSNDQLSHLRPILVDFLHGDTIDKINLSALDHIIVCVAMVSNNGQPTVAIRHYGILMKKSGNKYPRIELDEVGPRMNLIIKQYKSPDTQQFTAAMQSVKSLNNTLPKNIEAGTMGDKLGRIHIENQAIDTMALFKQKGLRKRGRSSGDMMSEQQINTLAEDDEDYDNIPQSINKVIKHKFDQQ